MTVFGDYSNYYDLLYRDKDYVSETDFIHSLIKTHMPDAKSILELGCGTGRHALLLADKKYSVHGIDLSAEMLLKAQERITEYSKAIQVQFSEGDIRHIQLNQTFDVVLSLFHVMSYQTTSEDFLSVLRTVKSHLKPGGIFVFDVWYGPAVLIDQPSVRVKNLENELIKITRVAEPTLYANENLVDVNYQVFITDIQSNTTNVLQETHRMRYWFKTELESLLNPLNLSLIEYGEWLTGRQAGSKTWGVYFVVQN